MIFYVVQEVKFIMEHNTNQNSNYLALLNLTDDGTYTVTKIEIIGSDKFVGLTDTLVTY